MTADSDNAVASARLGQVLRGKYRLERVLGIGGMGAVYAATHRNRKQFAIKVLHPELSSNPEVCTRFLREGYVANTVSHRGAVSVIDDDIAEDGSAFLVMELLEGTSVEELRERHGLSVSAVLAIADQLLDVLEAAHAKGIVHRDLKPANLFVTHEGVLKVLDFGIARLRDGSHNAITQTGSTLGTPVFMSPEQARGDTSAVDALSDVWSAGATLFALLSNQFVHPGDNPMEVLVKAATQPARSLAVVVPDLPPVLVQWVDRALAFDKMARWPNAAAMQTGLRSAHQAAFARPLGDAIPVLIAALSPARAPTDIAHPLGVAPLQVPDSRDLPAPSPVERLRDAGRGRWALIAVALAATAGGLAWYAAQRASQPAAVSGEGSPQLRPAAPLTPVVAPSGNGTALQPSAAGSPSPTLPSGQSEPEHRASALPNGQSAPEASASALQPSAAGSAAPQRLRSSQASIAKAAGPGVPVSAPARGAPALQPSAAAPSQPEPQSTIAVPKLPAAVKPSPATDSAFCTRFLERQSLGESLTPAETANFVRQCRGARVP